MAGYESEAVIGRVACVLCVEPESMLRAGRSSTRAGPGAMSALRELTSNSKGRLARQTLISTAHLAPAASTVAMTWRRTLTRAHRRSCAFTRMEALDLRGAAFSFTDEEGARLASATLPLQRAGLSASGGDGEVILSCGIPRCRPGRGVGRVILCSPENPSA